MKKFWDKLFGNSEKKEQDEKVCTISKQAQRAILVEQTLLDLIKALHGKTDTVEIIVNALKCICSFYDADWGGIMDLDAEVGLWMPICWYNREKNGMAPINYNGYEFSEPGPSWMKAFCNNEAIIIDDTEIVKETYMEEYEMYQKLGINNVIGVPFYKNATGFVVVRNPKRYQTSLTMMTFLTYVLMTEVVEFRLRERLRRTIQENTLSENDVFIKLFGELEIQTKNGRISEREISTKMGKQILVYLTFNKGVAFPARQLVELLWNEDGVEKPGDKVKKTLYRFNKEVSEYVPDRLIVSSEYGYRLNPKLNFTTDATQFEECWNSVRATEDKYNQRKILEKMMDVYRDRVLPGMSGELWLLEKDAYYSNIYLQAVEMLIDLLADIPDYPQIQNLTYNVLRIEKGFVKAHIWLIYSTCQMGSGDIAKDQLAAAKRMLHEPEFVEMKRLLEKMVEGIE